MRNFLRSLGLGLALCYSVFAHAQYTLPAGALEGIPVETMPAQDNAALLAKEQSLDRAGRAQQFAVALPVAIGLKNHGVWTQENGLSVWRTRIVSSGAKTLNLGFSEYNLPAGAELYLQSPEEGFGPFTSLDNDDHNQFWTPMLDGDELIVELRVPAALVSQVQLRVSFVNHDFTDLNKLLSGSCNLDVVCSEADGFGIVDAYRDIIRSVAAISTGGTGFCTGFLVNNVNNDGKPFFMTANHCGIDANAAPSLVTYWNFENSTCRQPNSTASGNAGNGSLDIFNTGAVHLASNPASDMTIVLLDDPVTPQANAFFAGWTAEETIPTDTIIAVHHPSVDEKRISFSFQDAFRSGWPNFDAAEADGDHLSIPDWDIGTTEGGSSGSPIFDRFGRVRGQLHGGGAACGNDLADSYGYFFTSWEGDGTPDTRLKDWLDPCGTGTIVMDGFDQSEIPATLTAESNCVRGCVQVDNAFAITLGNGYPAGTALTITSSSPGINPSLSTTSGVGGGQVQLILPADASVALGTYEVTVRASGGGLTDDITLSIVLLDDAAPAVDVASPADGATDVLPGTSLEWVASANTNFYEVEVSTSADFSNPLYSLTDIEETSVRLDAPLDGEVTYYWRVRSVNECGPGAWREVSFTTANLSCAAYNSGNLPLEITTASGGLVMNAEVEVTENFAVGTIEVTMDVDHTWLSDLSGFLISPSGTRVMLFETPGGFCSRDNLYATFSSMGAETAEEYGDNCRTTDANNRASAQPAESFDAFVGEDAAGTWIVSLEDNAGGDGGQFLAADISFCTTGNIADFRIRSNTTSVDVCEDSAERVVLSLGADYTDDVQLRVDAGGQMLDNFTFVFNPSDRTMTVDFTAWTLVGTGTYPLTFTLIETDNSERTFTLPLNIAEGVGNVELSSPEDNARRQEGEVTFTWANTPRAVSYVFQYSVNADFSVITFEQAVNTNVITVTNLPAGDVLYWRVIARNDCGETISDRRQFSLFPVGVHEFGAGRQLSVFPNPVRDQLTVEATGAWPTGYRADLFDASGRKLTDFRASGAGRSTWDLGHVPAGVYYLRFAAGGEQRTERLVVVK